jgi:hypothetical protein
MNVFTCECKSERLGECVGRTLRLCVHVPFCFDRLNLILKMALG